MNKQITEHKICIIPGVNEGRHHTKIFVRALRERGLKPTKKVAEAEIIVAHSGGCYIIPKNHGAKMVVLIDPPCDYQAAWIRMMHDKVRRDYHAHRAQGRTSYFFYKTLWNLWYGFARVRHNTKMARKLRTFATNLPPIKAGKVVIVANQHDPWSHNISQANIDKNRQYTFLSMAGTHDDIWMHPARYADVVQLYA